MHILSVWVCGYLGDCNGKRVRTRQTKARGTGLAAAPKHLLPALGFPLMLSPTGLIPTEAVARRCILGVHLPSRKDPDKGKKAEPSSKRLCKRPHHWSHCLFALGELTLEQKTTPNGESAPTPVTASNLRQAQNRSARAQRGGIT